MSFRDVTHPDDLAASLARFDRLRDGKVDRHDTEKRYLRKDGATVWARLTVSRVRMGGGVHDYFVATD
jgi:PAS domain S-box-containing protein